MLLQESILEIELSVRECIAKLSEMNYSDLTDGEVDASEDAGLMPESVHDRAVGLGLGLLLGHFGHARGSWSHCRGDGGALPHDHSVLESLPQPVEKKKNRRGRTPFCCRQKALLPVTTIQSVRPCSSSSSSRSP